MKKKTLIPLTVAAVAAMVVGANAVSAKTLTKTDIVNEYSADGEFYNNVYIVGNSLFQDTISLGEMLVASDNKPVVYHLASDGTTWTNAVDGSAVTVNSFELDLAYLNDADRTEVILSDDEKNAQLLALKAAYASLERKQYEGSSLTALDEANAMPETTPAEVRAKVEALNKALNSKVFVNEKKLRDLIAELDNVNSADYSRASYLEFKNTYDAVSKEIPKTFDEIEKKYKDLDTIKKTLAPDTASLNKEKQALTDLIAGQYDKVDTTKLLAKEEEYTPESWTVYSSALTNAESIRDNDDAKLTEVKAAFDALNSAQLNFKNLATLTSLKEEMKSYIDNEEYTANSRSILTTLVNNETPKTYAAIDTAIKDINAAKDNLITVASETALNDAIKATKTFSEDANSATEYNNDQLNSLKAEIKKGTDISTVTNGNYVINKGATYTNSEGKTVAVTDEYVQTIANSIMTEYSKIEYAALVELRAAIADAEKLDERDYLSTQWETFQSVLSTVKRALENNAFESNQDVASAKTSLVAAKAELIKPENKKSASEEDRNDLTLYINAEYEGGVRSDDNTKLKLKVGDYAKATHDVYVASIASAKTAETNPKSTVSDIENAKTAIETAKANLITKENEEALVAALSSAATIKDSADYETEFKKSVKAVYDRAYVTKEELVETNGSVTTIKSGAKLDGKIPTNSAIESYVSEIKALVDAPVFAKTSELVNAKELANKYIETGLFTDDSVAKLNTAITGSEGDEASNDAVTTKISAINDKITALVFKLQIDANNIDSTQYDKTELNKLSFTISTTVDEDENTIAKNVEKVVAHNKDLENAIKVAKANPINKKDLAGLIDDQYTGGVLKKDNADGKIDSTKYATYLSALETAENVYKRSNATYTEIKIAIQNLNDAITAITPTP